MIIDRPTSTEPLRLLWKQAFGDSDSYLDTFFRIGYSPERCFQATLEGKTAGALYWFDCQFGDGKIAYLYAVATEEAYRGQGVCRALMEHTHRHLQCLGYSGAILVPGSESLFRFYEKLGYKTCCSISEISCSAGIPVALQEIDSAEYARLRKALLPAGAVAQEGVLLDFLSSQASFYKGNQVLLCAAVEGDKAFIPELLGDTKQAPGIVAALGAREGLFRTPGSHRPFAMYYPLTACREMPAYFAFALD